MFQFINDFRFLRFGNTLSRKPIEIIRKLVFCQCFRCCEKSIRRIRNTRFVFNSLPKKWIVSVKTSVLAKLRNNKTLTLLWSETKNKRMFNEQEQVSAWRIESKPKRHFTKCVQFFQKTERIAIEKRAAVQNCILFYFALGLYIGNDWVELDAKHMG